MKLKITYIVLVLFFINNITKGQVPGFLGKTKIISGGLGVGSSIEGNFDKSFHFAFEVAKTRIRTSGLYYRLCTSGDDVYFAEKNGFEYIYLGSKMVHDIMWRWTFVNKAKGGLAPVGKYIALAAGTGIAQFKMGLFDIAPATTDSTLSKLAILPMLSFGAGRRALLSETLLLNWGWEFSYRFPIKSFIEFDNAIASASMFRIYLGVSVMTK